MLFSQHQRPPFCSPKPRVRALDWTKDALVHHSAGIALLPPARESPRSAAPFAKGPVESPQLIETEADLLDTFGQPYPKDSHYEYWLVASSYLAYGGVMRVVRADDEELKNGFIGIANSVKIKSPDDYTNSGYAENTIAGVTYAAKNPGSWSNGVKVCTIDGFGDQVLTHMGSWADNYNSWKESNLELLEGLEQLRFLENGYSIKCVPVDNKGRTFWELNNPEDVARIEKEINKNIA